MHRSDSQAYILNTLHARLRNFRDRWYIITQRYDNISSVFASVPQRAAMPMQEQVIADFRTALEHGGCTSLRVPSTDEVSSLQLWLT